MIKRKIMIKILISAASLRSSFLNLTPTHNLNHSKNKAQVFQLPVVK